MQRKHREVRSGLAAKGFIVDEQRRHIIFVYEDLEGRTTTARTLLSHASAGSDISDNLLGRMARQVGLASRDFVRLIDCPMSRNDFDAVVTERDGKNPKA
ncbi:MAG: hypothetical protein ACXW3U_16425 [Rhodoplanes sp.]